MAEREILVLDESTPQIEAAQSGDTYLFPRDVHFADGIKLLSKAADGASAIGFEFDTENALSTSGSKLLSIKNNGSEKFGITKDGYITSSSSAVFSSWARSNASTKCMYRLQLEHQQCRIFRICWSERHLLCRIRRCLWPVCMVSRWWGLHRSFCGEKGNG